LIRRIKIGIGYLTILFTVNVLAILFFELILKSDPSNVIDSVNLQIFIMAVIFAPPVEEFFFRFLPIRLIQIATSDKYIHWIVIFIASGIAILFFELILKISLFKGLAV